MVELGWTTEEKLWGVAILVSRLPYKGEVEPEILSHMTYIELDTVNNHSVLVHIHISLIMRVKLEVFKCMGIMQTCVIPIILSTTVLRDMDTGSCF